MVVPSSDPVATTDLGASEGGGTRRLRLDEMLAERQRPPLPPAPVLTIDPAPVDAAPVKGRRSEKKRLPARGGRGGGEKRGLGGGGAPPRRNLRAAEEARRVVHEERVLLEEEASARTQA